MPRAAVLITLSLLLIGCQSAPEPIDFDTSPIYVLYMHAGLTEIVLDRGTLSFMWHRPGEPMGQLQRRLSDDQIGQFHRWVGRNNLYMLDSEYPPPPDTGEVDRAMLTVRVRGVEQTIRWTDRSQIPDTLQVAVGELELFAKGLRTRQTESPSL